MSKEITNISIDVLKVHPRNTEFFDDISGKEYEEFKNSIKEEGIISEIIVAPDMTIISGHQRYKAAKELGIKLVPIRIREDLIDEDKKLKVLLAANFGRSKNDDRKQRKVADEYVRLCGFKHGEIGGGHQRSHYGISAQLSLSEIAQQLGTSRTNLTRALSIERNLTEDMKDCLDKGVFSKTVAADIISSLSEEEQERLIEKLDVTKKYTSKEIQKYISENEKLKKECENLKLSGKKYTQKEMDEAARQYKLRISELVQQGTKTEIVTKEVDRLETLDKIKTLQEKLDEKTKENINISANLIEKEKMISTALGTSTNYELVSHCSEITLKMLDFVKEMSKYDYMAESFNDIPNATRIEYERCIKSVKKWADRILETINTEKEIIEM